MGTEIEGRPNLGNDVQFPWETIAVTEHATHAVDVPSLYWDTTPVTNAAFAAFLAASAYTPVDAHNFLLDWGVGARTHPAGAETKPVTWVDLIDARAYCVHYGKRLPEDWEWQYAGQSSVPGRVYPWGDQFDAAAVPSKERGTGRSLPPDVGSFPRGDTSSGLKDMMGLVWQWTSEFTDAHTRAGLVRGGSYYTSMGCFMGASGCTNTTGWYFPNQLDGNPINHGTGVHLTSHGKLLLMAPAYDRHGTVGFRCVADGPPLPPPPPCTPGINHPNDDLPGMPIYNVSALACGSLCDANADCSIYVYVGTACLNPPNPALCYLKTGTPTPIAAPPCFCSGHGTHAPGL